jgi:hypothetical protein
VVLKNVLGAVGVPVVAASVAAASAVVSSVVATFVAAAFTVVAFVAATSVVTASFITIAADSSEATATTVWDRFGEGALLSLEPVVFTHTALAASTEEVVVAFVVAHTSFDSAVAATITAVTTSAIAGTSATTAVGSSDCFAALGSYRPDPAEVGSFKASAVVVMGNSEAGTRAGNSENCTPCMGRPSWLQYHLRFAGKQA